MSNVQQVIDLYNKAMAALAAVGIMSHEELDALATVVTAAEVCDDQTDLDDADDFADFLEDVQAIAMDRESTSETVADLARTFASEGVATLIDRVKP